MIDQAKAMPLGPARNAMWAKLDYLFMKNDAGWAPFMNRQIPKFVSSARARPGLQPHLLRAVPVDVAVQ